MFCLSVKEFLMEGEQVVDAATKGAMLGVVLGVENELYSINRKYEVCLFEINDLQANLRILRNMIKANNPKLDDLNETMGDLNVV